MIIDFHTHIFPPEIIADREKYIDRDPLFAALYSDPRVKLASAEDLIACMDEQGIDISVALNIAWSSPELCRQTNDYILESVARYPHRLVGFCMVCLDSPDTALEEISRCAQRGLKGVGEIRPDPEWLKDPRLVRPVIEKIVNQNLILLTHASEPLGHLYPGKGSITPEILYPFITASPGLKLVCAHWGGGLPFYALMPEVKKSLENVYFDSAASPYLYAPEIYACAAQLVGPEKVLFGSDYPLLKPGRLLDQINALDLSPDVKNQILSAGAQKLLGII